MIKIPEIFRRSPRIAVNLVGEGNEEGRIRSGKIMYVGFGKTVSGTPFGGRCDRDKSLRRRRQEGVLL